MRGQRLAELIERLRANRRITYFAKDMGVARDTVQRWTTGTADVGGAAFKLAAYIGTTDSRLEAYLNGEITLDELLINRQQDDRPAAITVGRVIAWLPGLSTQDLALLGKVIGDLLLDRTKLCGVGQLIKAELMKPDRPWGNEPHDAALALFSEESMIPIEELNSILSGEAPTPYQVGLLVRVLTRSDGSTWDVEELERIAGNCRIDTLSSKETEILRTEQPWAEPKA